MRKKLHKKYSK